MANTEIHIQTTLGDLIIVSGSMTEGRVNVSSTKNELNLEEGDVRDLIFALQKGMYDAGMRKQSEQQRRSDEQQESAPRQHNERQGQNSGSWLTRNKERRNR